MCQPDIQESFYSSFSAHHNSLQAEAQLQADLHLLAAVGAAAAPAHAAEPTAAAASVEPLSCSAQELHCCPFAAAEAAVASAAHAILAPFDALPLSLGVLRATHASVLQPQLYQSQGPGQVCSKRKQEQ